MAANGVRRWHDAVRNSPDKVHAATGKFWRRRGAIVHHRGVPMDPDALPDDPAALRQMLRELYAENDKLRLLIERLTRHQFGRRSEQLSVEQLQLGLEDQEQVVAEHRASQAAAAPIDPTARRSKPGGPRLTSIFQP